MRGFVFPAPDAIGSAVIRMNDNRSETDGWRSAKPPLDIDKSVHHAVERVLRAAREGALERMKRVPEEPQARAMKATPASAPDPEPAAQEPGIRVYDVADVERRRRASRTHDDADNASRMKAVLDGMLARGGWRRLRMLGPDWKRQIDELEQSFPNCAALFRYLRGQASLAMRHERALPGLALLLDGPPGVGKSVIAEAVAEVIGGGLLRIPMAAAQCGGQLSGSDEFWTNAKHGDVFGALINGDYANPVVQLDEIDKVNADLLYDPLGALYDLLEPAAAKRYCDRTFPSIPVDASRIIWIATSNNRRFIPAPILDRLTLIEIREPSRTESLRVVASVDRRLHDEQPALAGMRIGEAVLHALTAISPRRVRKALREAYGQAAYRGRDVVELDDLPSLDNAIPAIGFR